MTYHARIRRECGTETCPAIDRVQGRIGAALAILQRIRRDLFIGDTAREAINEAIAALLCERETLEAVRATAGAMRDTLADAMKRIDELEADVETGRQYENDQRVRADEAEAEVARLRGAAA